MPRFSTNATVRAKRPPRFSCRRVVEFVLISPHESLGSMVLLEQVLNGHEGSRVTRHGWKVPLKAKTLPNLLTIFLRGALDGDAPLQV